MKNKSYGLKIFILRCFIILAIMLTPAGIFMTAPAPHAEAANAMSYLPNNHPARSKWKQGVDEDVADAQARATGEGWRKKVNEWGLYLQNRAKRFLLHEIHRTPAADGSGDTGTPENKTGYKSWLTEPAAEAYKKVDSGVPDIDSGAAQAQVSDVYYTSTVEYELGKLVAKVGKGLDDAFRSTGADITISGIVMGKVSSGKNYWQFDLSDNNIYGRLGAIIYVCLRAVSLTFLIIFVAINIIKSLLYNEQKAWTELKSSVMGGIFAIIMITLMPQIVDWLCNLRDVLSLWMYRTASLYTIGDTSTADAAIGESLNIANDYYELYQNEETFINSLVYLAVVLMPAVWLINYVRIAISQLVLFGTFPMFCAAGARDKKALATWSSVFFTNIFIPTIDIVLIMLPAYILSYLQESVSSPENYGFVLLYAVITITAFMFIVPARNMLLKMLGNYFGIQMGGGLFAAGAAVGSAVGAAVGAASSIAGGGLKAIGGLGHGDDDGDGDGGDKMSDGGDKKSGGFGLSDREMQENMKTPDEIPSEGEDKNGLLGNGEDGDGKMGNTPDGGEMPPIMEDDKNGLDGLGGGDKEGENTDLEELTGANPENTEIPPSDEEELPPELGGQLDDEEKPLDDEELMTPPEEELANSLDNGEENPLNDEEGKNPLGDEEIPPKGDETNDTVPEGDESITPGAGTGFTMPDDTVPSGPHDTIEEDLTAASANLGMEAAADLPDSPKLDEFAGLGKNDVDKIREDTLTDKGASVEDAANNVYRANNLGAMDNLKDNIGKLDSYGQDLASEASSNKLEQAKVSTEMKDLRNKQKDFLDKAERNGKEFVNAADKAKNDKFNSDYHELSKKQVTLEKRGHDITARINANNARKAAYEQELVRRKAVEAQNAAIAQRKFGTAKAVTYDSAEAFKNSLKHNARMNKLADYKNYNSSDFKGTMTVKQRVKFEQEQRRAEAMGQVASGATKAAAAFTSAFVTVGMMSAGPEEALRAGRAVRDTGNNLADHNREVTEYVVSGELKNDITSAGRTVGGAVNHVKKDVNDAKAYNAAKKAYKKRDGVGDVQHKDSVVGQGKSSTKKPSRGKKTLEGQSKFSFDKKVDEVMKKNLNNSHPDNRERDKAAKDFVDDKMKNA